MRETAVVLLLGVSQTLTFCFPVFSLISVSGNGIRQAKGIFQIKGLHPTGTRAHAGKRVVICGVKSGKRGLRDDQMENS
jgi:hypothetical protein